LPQTKNNFGLEPVITNNQAEQIGNQMMPDLKRGDYSAALLIGVTRIAQLIGAESKVQLNTVPAGPTT
jgi:uncharacterized membrane protein YgcG